MRRKLVDRYPCKHCGAPCDVERRRDIPQACCDSCAKRRSTISMLNWGLDAAHRKAETANRSKANQPMVAGWLRVSGGRLETVGRAVDDIDKLSRSEQRAVLSHVRRHMANVVRDLDVLRSWVDALESELNLGFELIAGDAAPSEQVTPPPALRLVPGTEKATP